MNRVLVDGGATVSSVANYYSPIETAQNSEADDSDESDDNEVSIIEYSLIHK